MSRLGGKSCSKENLKATRLFENAWNIRYFDELVELKTTEERQARNNRFFKPRL